MVVGGVATAAKKAIWPKNAKNHATWTTLPVAIARKLGTSVEIVQNRRTVRILAVFENVKNRPILTDLTTGSKVQCSNCQQYGHTKVRCKEPLVEEDDGFGQAGDSSKANGGDSSWPSGDGNTETAAVADGGW